MITDPTSESLPLNPLNTFYIPRDEIFEQVKNSDFSADAVKSFSHKLLSAIKEVIDHEPDFSGFADVRSLYAPEGANLGGLNNLKPNTPNPTGEQHPELSFVREFIGSGGEDTNLLLYPLPRVIAGA